MGRLGRRAATRRQRRDFVPEPVEPLKPPVGPGQVKLVYDPERDRYEFYIGYDNGQGHWRADLRQEQAVQFVIQAKELGLA
jgi:hypothetical protein